MIRDMRVLEQGGEEKDESARNRAARLFKEGISQMEDSLMVPEEERASFEQKIRMKLKTGRPLSAKELNYLRIHNPEMYRSAMRIEMSRKILKNQLKGCKSKEDVQRVVSNQLSVLRSMEGDPDREYMMAMVQREIEKFKKSAAYARLPETEEGKNGGKKHKKKTGSFHDFPIIVQSLRENEALSAQLQNLLPKGGALVDSGGACQI